MLREKRFNLEKTVHFRHHHSTHIVFTRFRLSSTTCGLTSFVIMFNRRGMNEICCHHHPDAQLIEDYHAGDMICSECGLVVGDRVIDVGSEWRTFSNNDKTTEDPSRVGGPENPLLNGNDLSTIIGPARGDASFDESGMAKYHNRKTMSSSDITLMNAFREIASMSDKINLSKSIVDRANALFKQVYDKKMKGSNNGLATACLYIACRLEHVPRTFKEICAVSKVNKTNIAKFYRKIKNEFEMRLDLISAEDFMPRFCTKLGLPNTVQRVATHIAKEAVDIDIVIGKSPISVAAAAIYMASQASGEFKKQVKEIGDVAGTAESTIQTSYKEMLPHAACLFPNTFKSPIPIEQLLPKS